jgi:hypothetical protein
MSPAQKAVAAAVEYERAADQIRLAERCGRVTDTDRQRVKTAREELDRQQRKSS